MGEMSVPMTSQWGNWSAKSLYRSLVGDGTVGIIWHVHGPESRSSPNVYRFLKRMSARGSLFLREACVCIYLDIIL